MSDPPKRAAHLFPGIRQRDQQFICNSSAYIILFLIYYPLAGLKTLPHSFLVS